MKEKTTTSNFSQGISFVCTQSRPEKIAIFIFPQFVRNLDIRF